MLNDNVSALGKRTKGVHIPQFLLWKLRVYRHTCSDIYTFCVWSVPDKREPKTRQRQAKERQNTEKLKCHGHRHLFVI